MPTSASRRPATRARRFEFRVHDARMSRASADRPILIFIAVAYALSVALSLLIGLTGGYRSRWIGLGYLSMLIPAASVLITIVLTRDRQRPIGWDRFPLRYLPPALFLM